MNNDPGLDLDALRALRTTTRDLSLLKSRIQSHLDAHEGYLAFSGGKDSLVALHLTRQVDPDVPVVFFDSGLEFPETYTYLERLLHTWSLNLHVVPARRTTLDILRASGTWDHHATTDPDTPNLHEVLIAEPASRAHRVHGPGEIWGVRAQESRGRAAAYANALRAATCTCLRACTPSTVRAHHGGLIARVDGTTVYGPVWDWKTAEIWAHINAHHLPVNPVYDKLRSLGAPEHFLRVSHMLDASRLEEGRVTWLRRGWPAMFEELATILPRIREYV